MNALEGTAPRTQGPFFFFFSLFAYWWQKDSGRFHVPVMEHRGNGLLCVPFNLTVHLIILFFFSSFVCSFLKQFIFSSHHYHLDHIRWEKLSPQTISTAAPLTVLHMHNIVPSPSFPIVWSHFQLGLFLRWLCEEPWKCSSSSPMDSDRLCMV